MRFDHVVAQHASELVGVQLMAARCPISMFPELRAQRAPKMVRAALVENEIAPRPIRPLQGILDVHLDADSLCRRPRRRAAALAHRLRPKLVKLTRQARPSSARSNSACSLILDQVSVLLESVGRAGADLARSGDGFRRRLAAAAAGVDMLVARDIRSPE